MRPAPTPIDVARRFVERINAHDAGGLALLMADDRRFIDSLGACSPAAR
ncbi:MAG: hypothetical protein U1E76_17360 [Planctomycetota bacterium]